MTEPLSRDMPQSLALERLQKEKRADYVPPEMARARIEDTTSAFRAWGQIDPSDANSMMVCESCRKDPRSRTRNATNLTWCLFCCANYQSKGSDYSATYNVNRKRAERLELAARLKAYLDEIN